MKLRVNMEKIIMCFIFIVCYSFISGQKLSNQKELNEAFDVFIKHFQDNNNRELEFQRKFDEQIDSTKYIIKLPVLWESYFEKKQG